MKDKEVINEFYEVCLAQQYIAEGGINYAKELLEKAYGEEKALDVIGRLTASLQVKPFEFVRKTDASQLLNFIVDEHPQTIALVLSYLTTQQSAMIIAALPPDRQADVARRIAVMDRTSPDVIKEVEKVLAGWDAKGQISLDYGTLVHECIETFIKHGELPTNEYLKSIVEDWREACGGDFDSEVFVQDDAHQLCGVIDLLGGCKRGNPNRRCCDPGGIG